MIVRTPMGTGVDYRIGTRLTSHTTSSGEAPERRLPRRRLRDAIGFDQRTERLEVDGRSVTRVRMYVTVAPEARHVRRVLGPMAWVVLEDLAGGGILDASARLIAPTSPQHIARRLGITPDTVRKYLKVLLERGLVTQEPNDGRYPPEFTRVYVLNPRTSLDPLFESDGDGAEG
jgi:DNA-binding IclR family transcriptional regulator